LIVRHLRGKADIVPHEQPASRVVIKTRKDGPLLVTGAFTLTDHLGNPYDTTNQPNIALCRCGHSRRKPFCDGSHRNTDFRAEELADGGPGDHADSDSSASP
jgi:CDGSH-type Zn-finger protein